MPPSDITDLSSAEPQKQHTRPWVRVLRWCILAGVGIYLAFALYCLFVPNRSVAHSLSREQLCERNLRDISAMLDDYQRASGKYPAPRKKTPQGMEISWRQELAMEDGAEWWYLYGDYRPDEPWNSEWNLSQNIRLFNTFACMPKLSGKQEKEPFSETSFLMVIRNAPLDSLPDRMVIVVESADCGIHWMEPRDLEMATLREADSLFGPGKLNSYHDGYVNALRKNGKVIRIPKNLSKERALAILDGAEV